MSERWRAQIRMAIESSDKFILIISPDSVASEPCAFELDQAIELNKQVITILRRDPGPLPPGTNENIVDAVREITWIPFADDAIPGAALDQVIEAIDTDLGRARTHSLLLTLSREWDETERDPSRLPRGRTLRGFDTWLAEAGDHIRPTPIPVQREYVTAGRQAADRRRRWWQAAAALVTVIAVVVAVVIVTLNKSTVTQGDAKAANEIVVEADRLAVSDPSLAAQLDLVANQISSSPSSEARLISTTTVPLYGKLTGPADPVNSVAFSRDGKVLAAGDQNGRIWLWKVTGTGSPVRLGGPLSGPTRNIDSVAISPNGQILAASSGNRIWLWSLARLDHPALVGSPLSGSARPYGTVVFSPDGNTLASADTLGTVWRWSLADPAHPARLSSLTGPVGTIFSVAFSPDGKILAAAGEDRTVWLWNVARLVRPVLLSRLTGLPASIYAVAFSRTGILAAGSGDDKVWLWSLADPARPARLGQPLTGLASFAVTLAFSPDGNMLAAGTGNNTTLLWNLASPAGPERLARSLIGGGTSSIESVAFSPAGPALTLAAASTDGTIRWWTLPADVLVGPADPVDTVAFSADGKTLASGDTGGRVWLWDLADSHQSARLGPPLVLPGVVTSVAFSPKAPILAASTGNTRGAQIWLWDLAKPAHPVLIAKVPSPQIPDESLAFSPDGRTLAVGTGFFASQVWLWHLTDPAHPAGLTRLGSPLTGPRLLINSLAFSPNGKTLAGASADSKVWLWHLTGPARAASSLTGPEHTLNSVAFSPDGKTLAAGGYDHKVWLWSLAEPAHPDRLAPLTGPVTPVDAVVFSPDRKTLAASSDDGDVWLWNVADPAQPVPLGQPLTGSANAVRSVAFSPDGRILAGGSYDWTADLWDLDVDDAVQRICASTFNVMTRQLWDQYVDQVASLPYAPPCDNPGRYGLLTP